MGESAREAGKLACEAESIFFFLDSVLLIRRIISPLLNLAPVAISGGVTQPLQEQLTNSTLTSRRCTPQFDGFVCAQLRGTYWSVFLTVCMVCACDTHAVCVCLCVGGAAVAC